MKLIKYHNDINTLKLGSFGEKELDVFFSILYKMRDRGSEEITLSYSELHKLANTSHNKRMFGYISSLEDKLLSLKQQITLPDGRIRTFNLFEYIDKKEDWNYINVKTTETFTYILNDLIGNYTRFDLKALVNLKSGYSKQLFKLLKQYEGNKDNINPWYKVELKEFKELLGVPKSYTTTDLNIRVLKPIKEELGEVFPNFQITKLTKDGQLVGRGRRTHSLKFTWEKESKVPKIEPIKYKYESKPTQPQGTKISKRESEEPRVEMRAPEISELRLYKNKVNGLAHKQLPPSPRQDFITKVEAAKTKQEVDDLVLECNINLPLF